MKIITMCGSTKYRKEMNEITEKLTFDGNCVLTPIELVKLDKEKISETEKEALGKAHREKIKLSDAIFVVNVNNYIGDSTKAEIEYAKSLNKEVIYYSELTI